MKKPSAKKALFFIFIIILVASIMLINVLADAGSFSGGSDYGGGSDWGGGSNWGGSDSYGGGGFFFSNDSDTGEGIGSSFLTVLVIVAIVVIIAAKRSRVGVGRNNASSVGSLTLALWPIQSLREADEHFSEAAITEKISNLYVRMQDAWQNKNFEVMRPYMTDTLYNQFLRQLDELIDSKQTNYIDRIAVLDVSLSGWSNDDINDSLVAILNTRIVDYTLDDNSGKLVSGSKTSEKFMSYEWSLIRTAGMKTPPPSSGVGDGISSVHCPSCGAPLDINHSAKCEYCGSLISAKDYDWVISNIKGISQRSV